MTRENLKKKWKLIEAFKSGADIEYYSISRERWISTDEPAFVLGTDYRIKPSFVPETFEEILVSNDNSTCVKRTFIAMHYGSFACLAQYNKTPKIIIQTSLSLNVNMWSFTKLLCEE